MDNAIVLVGGPLTGDNAKTAHGLIRKTSRFNIAGVIADVAGNGQDAGYLLDKVKRNIPVYSTLEAFLQQSDKKPQFAIVGVAFGS